MHALLSATTGLITAATHLELSLVMIVARLAVSYAVNRLLRPALPERMKSLSLPILIGASVALIARRSAQ